MKHIEMKYKRNESKHKKYAKTNLSFLQAIRIYAGMPVEGRA